MIQRDRGLFGTRAARPLPPPHDDRAEGGTRDMNAPCRIEHLRCDTAT